MKALRHLSTISKALLFTSICMACSSGWAADAPPAQDQAPTKEMRAKMASAHEKMAACLRTERPVADCRHEMMQSCKEMGGPACGMMGDRHKMMMHGEGEHEHAAPGGTPATKP